MNFPPIFLIFFLPILTKCDKTSQYDEFVNKMFRKIKEAEENYEETPGLSTRNYFGKQVDRDLEPFTKNGISQKMIEETSPLGVKYQIIGHRLYRQEKCTFPARCEGVEHFLKEILSQLPDTEFILNDSDVPKAFKGIELMPLFSFSKDEHVFDILYPAWAFWSGGPSLSIYPKGIGNWDKMRKDVFSISDRLSWNEKRQKAFFLGSRTSSLRDPLVRLSRRNPDLVDAKYTKNQAYKGPQDTLGMEPAEELPFEENCYYKYLFNFRGVAASFRFKHLFLCKSLVFHIDGGMEEFFYHKLIPYYHYIPVEENTEEGLERLIKFFISHDEIAEKIAQNGANWMRTKLTNRDIKNYWTILLDKYTSLLKYSVVSDPNLTPL